MPGSPRSGFVPVSVVIPAYNREELVVRAVASALAQRPLPPAEVIVVDDASTDGTAEAAERAGARVIRHDVNQGEGAARNTGFEAAQHEWIGLLDSDDEWLPHCLARLWPHRAGMVLVGGGAIKTSGRVEDEAYGGVLRLTRLKSPAQLVFPENLLVAAGTMVRRDVALAAGGYRRLPHAADLDLWLRVLERGPGLALPVPVLRYHLHAGQVTQDHAAMSAAHERVALSYADRPWFSATGLERWRGTADWDRLRRLARDGDTAGARRVVGGLVRRPQRLVGVAVILTRRMRLRRATGRMRLAAQVDPVG